MQPQQGQLIDPTVSATQSKILFLQTCLDDEAKIFLYWDDTSDERQQKLKNKAYTIQQYFTEFRCLKQDFGYKLLNLDFEKLYPNAINSLSNNWPTINEKLINYFEKTKKDNLLDILQEKNILTGFRLLALFLGKSVYHHNINIDGKKSGE